MRLWRAGSVLGMVVFGLVASGCGSKQDNAPAVAKATVHINKTKAPLGSPLDITYRFEVAPGASFTQDYRVLAHFLDADEELMWTDDHGPAIPTSQWKPGQVVEYTRTMFVPVYPYVGQATVTVGLYAAGTSERLPLTGELVGEREYKAATVELLPQHDGVLVVFKDGWHPAEAAPDNPTLEWQWTKKDATVSFRNPRRNATLFLHYDGQPSLAGGQQTVTVQLHGETVDTFQVMAPQEDVRRIPLKAAQFGTEDLVDVRLLLDKTFVPALAGGNARDPRELGIRVYHAYVEPQ